MDADQQPRVPLGARGPDDACQRDRRSPRCGHDPEGRGREGHPLHRPAVGTARGEGRPDPPDPRARAAGDEPGYGQHRGDRDGFPAFAGHEPRPCGPRGLSTDEDHSRRWRPPGLPRSRGSESGAGAARSPRASAQQDPWHYSIARMVDACSSAGILPFYGPFGDIHDLEGCDTQFRSASGSDARSRSLHPVQIEIAKRALKP